MTNKDVVDIFLDQLEGNSLNLHSRSNKLYSYNTCIAQWYNNSIIFNISYYSKTTSCHQGLLRRKIGNRFPIAEVNKVPQGTHDLKFYILSYNNKYEV